MTLQKPYTKKPVFSLFPEKVKLIEEFKCTSCEQPIKEEDFRDTLSKKEYTVSGMCQKCQDRVFGE